MVQYNPKDWITFIFRFHKSDTFRKLIPMMLFIGAYTGGVGYLELEYWKLSEKNHLSNITVMHGMLGFVISLLLVFRTNTAYDRWWEGRKLWGALVNNSRNLAMKLSVILKEEHDRVYFKKLIPSYASILSKHLTDKETSLQLYDGIELDNHKHRPNQVATMMYQKVNDLHEQEKITGDQLIILNAELQSFTDICGACERIKNTPIPYSYSAFIKKFIFFYIMTLPFGYVFSLGYYAIPVVIFIFYVLASLELIAEEIEDPFGIDANDLPIEKISANIKKHVEEII
ncbi:Bestrophin-2C RFP-TM-2C chloride channel [Mariniflexile rhizosphaerae]|uniref:bestrophin family protein n=1 Tax=unclassified Mariniflexile TaxID=2643887 RepID=UPI000CC4C7C7|nr:bestrophin family ion channel [Mariniflexile sp. TRM1-10]AXP81794.1 Bestrophin-2C RFP-TM-2C chloride channel [Mariniflexile sp. TRM1-10]PLB20824.1 MAG: putative membrane protein [Flavobacteriaceae bacterium FS1-H7996/R]